MIYIHCKWHNTYSYDTTCLQVLYFNSHFMAHLLFVSIVFFDSILHEMNNQQIINTKYNMRPFFLLIQYYFLYASCTDSDIQCPVFELHVLCYADLIHRGNLILRWCRSFVYALSLSLSFQEMRDLDTRPHL